MDGLPRETEKGASANVTFENALIMLTLIADSGSTKTAWLLRNESSDIASFTTEGINPFLLDDTAIIDIIATQLLPTLAERRSEIATLRFYGAGCRDRQTERMGRLLRNLFPDAEIDVASDLLCAARALCGKEKGIACILGTGANSCLFDGRKIVANTPALGFILGDEGSGAVLGRRLIGDIYKHQLSPAIREAFEQETGATMSEVVERVYRCPAPNRYLAGFTRFIARHREEEQIRALVIDELRRFFKRNVEGYAQGHQLPVHFVGGIAYHFSEELKEAARLEGFIVGRVIERPLDRAEYL